MSNNIPGVLIVYRTNNLSGCKNSNQLITTGYKIARLINIIVQVVYDLIDRLS